jgi:hypothetical protein
MPFSGDPGVAPRGEEHRISACLSHVAAAGAARGAKGNGEAQEAIRGNKLSEAAMHAPGEERRDPKKSATARKKAAQYSQTETKQLALTHSFVQLHSNASSSQLRLTINPLQNKIKIKK